MGPDVASGRRTFIFNDNTVQEKPSKTAERNASEIMWRKVIPKEATSKNERGRGTLGPLLGDGAGGLG